MSEAESHEAHEHEYEEIGGAAGPAANHLTVENLQDIKLDVSVDLGGTTMYVRDVLELTRGSILPLNKLAGEMVDIYVNGCRIARGEVMVVGDSLTVRVSEVLGDETIYGGMSSA